MYLAEASRMGRIFKHKTNSMSKAWKWVKKKATTENIDSIAIYYYESDDEYDDREEAFYATSKTFRRIFQCSSDLDSCFHVKACLIKSSSPRFYEEDETHKDVEDIDETHEDFENFDEAFKELKKRTTQSLSDKKLKSPFLRRR